MTEQVTTSPKDLSGPEFAGERMGMFIARVAALKERKLVTEILERELMLTLINAHQDHILEYPLIPVQQHSIVHALTIRAAENEALFPHLHKALEAFMAALTAYSRAEADDAEERGRLLAAALNCETMLIKCVQGATYAFALCQDNFLEVLFRRYGESALDFSDNIIEECEMDDVFWRRHFEHFSIALVDKAFEEVTRQEDFILNKTGNALVLTYPLDALVKHLREGASRMQKSRIQLDVENAKAVDSDLEPVFKTVNVFLQQNITSGALPLPVGDVDFISQITCLDPCAKALHQIASGKAPAADAKAASPAAPEQDPAAQSRFIQGQVLAMACAVGISLDILRRDMIRGLPDMDAQNAEIINRQVADFSLLNLDKIIYFLAEHRLAQILRERCGESISKMQISSSRTRRIPSLAIDRLMKLGLGKIKRNRLWQPDPDEPEQMLFRPRALPELNKELDFLMVEPDLKNEILLLWQRAPYKVEFNVAIMLSLLAQTTTNLNYRLTEILARFGVKMA